MGRTERTKLVLTTALLILEAALFGGCRGTIIPGDGGDQTAQDGADSQDLSPTDDAGSDGADSGADPTADAGPDGADSGADLNDDAGPDGADQASDPGPCPAQLSARIARSVVSVSPTNINTAAGGYFSPYTPPILAPHQSGAWTGWQGTDGKVHLTPLDADLARAGQDVTLEGNELRGLAAHSAGFAVMF